MKNVYYQTIYFFFFFLINWVHSVYMHVILQRSITSEWTVILHRVQPTEHVTGAVFGPRACLRDKKGKENT